MPTLRVGITIFGEPSGYPTNAIIAEYKSFIEANSNLTLDITVSRHEALSQSELYSGDGGSTWYIDVAFLTTTHKSYIPTNVQVNIILYNWLGLTPAHGGLTWGGYGDPTGNNIPVSTLHMGAPGQASPDGPWTYGLSNGMAHEFLHALGGAPGDPGDSSILSILGFSNFIDMDNCCFYGFNGFNWTPSGCPPPNDPGWQNCMRHFINMITPNMYIALGDPGAMTFHTNPGGCDLWKNNIYTPSIKLGTTDSYGNLTLTNLMSGTIDFIVKKIGYYDSPEARTIVIGGQYRDTQLVTLVQKTGSIRFHTSPGNADIWRGTTKLGTTSTSGTLLIIDIPIGVLNYIIKKTGYYDSPIQNITVIENTIVDTPLVTLIQKTGSVRFHTSPGGTDIWQGTTKLGITDSNGILLVPNLVIGSLSYIAKRIGYYDSPTQNVIVIENIIVDASLVTLVQKTGSVNISSSPSGAKIYIDGIEQIGRLTPTTISGLSQSPPNHTYKLMLTGYEDATGTFDIIADQTTTVPTIVLAPISLITGTVIIISNPPGAKIYIDDIEQIGRLTPSTVANVPPSPPSHTYKLTLVGYNDKSDSFDISPGEIKMIDVGNLTPIVAQAGFSPAGMILIAGLVIGAIYSEIRKKEETKAKAI